MFRHLDPENSQYPRYLASYQNICMSPKITNLMFLSYLRVEESNAYCAIALYAPTKESTLGHF